MLLFEFLLRLSAILKLDFSKSPGKSGSVRPPRGMKIGNKVNLWSFELENFFKFVLA